MALSDSAIVVEKAGGLELAQGGVDADREVMAVLLPPAGLRARGLDHPPADRVDQAGVLGDRDEPQRGDEPAARLAPAQQCLHCDELVAGQVEDRLVMQDEVILRQRLAHAHGQDQALERLLRPPRVDDEVPAPQALRLVHGGVGMAQESVLVLRVVGEDADADAGTELELGAGKRKRLLQGGHDLTHHDLHELVGAAVEIGQQYAELVAAGSCHEAGLTDAFAQAGGDEAQRLVSGSMAETVVDELEVIEADVQEGNLAIVLLCPGQGHGQVLAQQAPGRQPRQLITELPARLRLLRAVAILAHARLSDYFGERGGPVRACLLSLLLPGLLTHLLQDPIHVLGVRAQPLVAVAEAVTQARQPRPLRRGGRGRPTARRPEPHRLVSAVAERLDGRPAAAAQRHRLSPAVDLGPVLIDQLEGSADEQRSVAVGRDSGGLALGHADRPTARARRGGPVGGPPVPGGLGRRCRSASRGTGSPSCAPPSSS